MHSDELCPMIGIGLDSQDSKCIALNVHSLQTLVYRLEA